MTARSVVEVRRAPASVIGDLETLTPLSDPTDAALDPFLLLAHHGPQEFPPNNRGLPFDAHPHRGFGTVTFVLDGALVHSDSLGERREVSGGGVITVITSAGILRNAPLFEMSEPTSTGSWRSTSRARSCSRRKPRGRWWTAGARGRWC